MRQARGITETSRMLHCGVRFAFDAAGATLRRAAAPDWFVRHTRGVRHTWRMSDTSGARAVADRFSRSFEVGMHVIRVTKITEGRWLASVDDTLCGTGFTSSAEAWEAGVRLADQNDRRDGVD